MLIKSTSIMFPLFVLLFYGCSSTPTQDIKGKDGFAVLPAAAQGEQVANFAGGCFWATQACMLQLKGVNKVISGYAGGTTKNPTYANVLSGDTGHAESVQVYYDPKIINYRKLADAFFHAHDPTQVDGQGPDIGSDYRSIAFYRNDTEHKALLALLKEMAATYREPVVTELAEFNVFYPAEMEHQDYYTRNPWDPYIRNVSRPKVLKLQESMTELIKTEYLE
jgi:peptide-methionine (S)-S-oxide reductase